MIVINANTAENPLKTLEIKIKNTNEKITVVSNPNLNLLAATKNSREKISVANKALPIISFTNTHLTSSKLHTI